MIQSSYRGHSARREIRKQRAAAIKIQAVQRGRHVRRDMDFRSRSTKRQAATALQNDLADMGDRMRQSARAMDGHAERVDNELLRVAKKDGSKYTADIVQELAEKKHKRESSRRRL